MQLNLYIKKKKLLKKNTYNIYKGKVIILNNELDENTMNNIKKMVDSGNINGAISQISPEMIQNFSKMFQNTSKPKNNNEQENNDSNLNGIDINTIIKLSSSINSNSDPRNNLLSSLKPYLRDNKKEKLDSYINLLNMSKIAETIKNNKNFSNKEDT